jgi:hypothetical protein
VQGGIWHLDVSIVDSAYRATSAEVLSSIFIEEAIRTNNTFVGRCVVLHAKSSSEVLSLSAVLTTAATR